MDNPTADWNLLNDKFYRKVQVYEMEWRDDNMDLSMYTCATARFGTPIALVRDDKKLIRVQNSAVSPDIYVYSPSGVHWMTITSDRGRIVSMGWSDALELVVVNEEGSVCLYDINGVFLRSFSLGQSIRNTTVVRAMVWENGLVALTSDFQFVCVLDFVEAKPLKLPSIDNIDSPPTCWTFNPPNSSMDTLSVYVSYRNTVYRLGLDEPEAEHMPLLDSATNYAVMCVTYDGTLLACVDEDSHFTVMSIESSRILTQSILETDFQSKTLPPPKQMVWCANDCVVMTWDHGGLVMAVGPFSGVLTYQYDNQCVLVGELDGVRVIGKDSHDFLERVPRCVENTFKFGSTEPPAMLLDASRLYDAGNARCDELLRSIKGSALDDAVLQLLRVGGYEWESTSQKDIMRAASFGRSFCTTRVEFGGTQRGLHEGHVNDGDSDFENEEIDFPQLFEATCMKLRVLNCIRKHTVGIPLTLRQLKALTPQLLLLRMSQLGYHALAYRICTYLRIDVSEVLVHWACEKVRRGASFDDDTICGDITSKFTAHIQLGSSNAPMRARTVAIAKHISYAKIAKCAQINGRPGLAIKLLKYEPHMRDMIPLLLSLKESELALREAVQYGDPDLIYHAILHLKRTLPLGDFLHTIHSQATACDLLVLWCKDHDLSLLKDFYYQDDRGLELALFQVRQAKQDTKAVTLEEEHNDLRVAMKTLSGNRITTFYEKTIEEHITLQRLQRKLERASEAEGRPAQFLNLSAVDTVYSLLVAGKAKQAADFKANSKLSDKKFWWLKVRAYAQTQDWEGLERFAKSRSSPIGYRPFVEECLGKGAQAEAVKYIPKCPLDDRVELYCDAHYFREAVEAAVLLKSREKLFLIRKKSNQRRDVVAMCDRVAEGIPY
eukprot:CFRG6955T1